MLLTACTMKTAPRVVHVQPPEQILTCKDAPEKPSVEATQKTIAVWVTNLYFSWKDCYYKLNGVKIFTEDN